MMWIVYYEVPEFFEQLRSWVGALCAGRTELLEVFSWDREMLTVITEYATIQARRLPDGY